MVPNPSSPLDRLLEVADAANSLRGRDLLGDIRCEINDGAEVAPWVRGIQLARDLALLDADAAYYLVDVLTEAAVGRGFDDDPTLHAIGAEMQAIERREGLGEDEVYLDASKKLAILPFVTTATLDVPRIAQLCNALADEARVEIVARLLDGEKCVCDLTDALETGQSRLSYHLKVLKDAGLVTDRREGRWSYYTLARDAFLETEELLSALRPRATRAPKVSCC
jgi:ArsR family transcriptional regulator, arsenate/arsenite/antimonite-responsive transcriptional repressor